jgi:hypothetical protein
MSNTRSKAVALILIVSVAIGIIIGFVVKIMEGYTNYESFGSLDDLDVIKSDVSTIRSKLSTEYPDMSKYVQKSELPSTKTCRVANAVDKDSYVSKTEMEQLSSKATGCDPDKYILKSAAIQSSSSVSTCPTLDPTQWVLKSSLPPQQACPACVCPKVKVSAGLCQKCPKPPKCPEVKPCPVPECPKPQPCPPQKECPACPPKEHCPPKICAPCPAMPTEKVCPKCCDRDVIKVLKKTVYVDQNGKEIRSNEEIINANGKELDPTNMTLNDLIASYNQQTDDNTPQDPAGSTYRAPLASGSGLVIPSPSPTFAGSTSTGGSLAEQSQSGNVNNTPYPSSTPNPYVQSYKVNNSQYGTSAGQYNSRGQYVQGGNVQYGQGQGQGQGPVGSSSNSSKGCSSSAFNSEFQEYGVYGDSKKNMYNDYLTL